MNKKSLTKISVIFFIVLGIFLFLNLIPADPSYIIDGDKVYINDSNAYISAYPHTISESGWVYFNVTSKVYEGDVDVIWGFNTTYLTPKKAELFNPHNVTKSYTCPTEFFNYTISPNYFWCYENITYFDNQTMQDESRLELIREGNFEWGDIPSKTAYWNVTENWVDFTSSFDSVNHDFGGMNKWYYIRNVAIQQGKEYSVRGFIEIPRGNGFSPMKLDEKYWFAIKPSGETIQEAISNNHLYYLDPWINSAGENANKDYLDVGLVSGWNFSSNISNVNSSNSLNPSLGSPTVMSGGLIGDAMYFDGNDRYHTQEDRLYYNINNPNTTWSIWFNISAQPHASYHDNILHVVSSGILIQVQNDGGVQVIMSNVGTTHALGVAYDGTEWHHVVISCNSTGQTLYFDGKPMINKSGFQYQTTEVLALGAHDTASQSYLNGMLDEFYVWERELNATEVLDLYNSGNGIGYTPTFTPPAFSITINNPTNNSYNYTSIDFNATGNENLGTCIVSLNNFTTNNTMSVGSTLAGITLTQTSGSKTASFWCNNSDGDESDIQFRDFTVNLPPAVSLNSPADDTSELPGSIITFNFTPSDDIALLNASIFLGDLNATNWWDSGWDKKKLISLTPAMNLSAGSVYNLTITDSEVMANTNADGSDLRVVYKNTAEANTTILLYNSSTAIVSFMIQEALTNGTIDRNYTVYYDNAGASLPSKKIFYLDLVHEQPVSDFMCGGGTVFDYNSTDMIIAVQGDSKDGDANEDITLVDYDYINDVVKWDIEVINSSLVAGTAALHPAITKHNGYWFLTWMNYTGDYDVTEMYVRNTSDFVTWSDDVLINSGTGASYIRIKAINSSDYWLLYPGRNEDNLYYFLINNATGEIGSKTLLYGSVDNSQMTSELEYDNGSGMWYMWYEHNPPGTLYRINCSANCDNSGSWGGKTQIALNTEAPHFTLEQFGDVAIIYYNDYDIQTPRLAWWNNLTASINESSYLNDINVSIVVSTAIVQNMEKVDDHHFIYAQALIDDSANSTVWAGYYKVNYYEGEEEVNYTLGTEEIQGVGAWNIVNSTSTLTNGSGNILTYNISTSGGYVWNVLVYDTNESLAWGTNRSLIMASNTFPETTTPSIYPTQPEANSDLNCSFVINDSNSGDYLSANITWHKDGAVDYSINISVGNGNLSSTILKSDNTSLGETWLCQVLPYDGSSYGTAVNSSGVLVSNYIAPNITIESPANITYPSYLDFNVSSDENLSDCWWSTDSFETNITMTEFNKTYFNYTNTSIGDGSYTARFWCNDSFNNINDSETVDFTIDGVFPSVTINTPTAYQNFSSGIVSFNFSIDEDWGEHAVYSIDNLDANISMTNTSLRDFNFTSATPLPEGIYQAYFAVNDTVGNLNMTEWVNFTIDTTYPEVEFDYPLNATYNANIDELNYTYTETNCESVWYTNASRITNSSRVACGTNFTSVDYIEGSNIWILYINDTVGNENSTSLDFTIDTVAPAIDIVYPGDYANTTDTGIDVNYTRSVVDSCWYSNDTFTYNTTLTNCNNVTSVTWSEGEHNVTIYANDTAGNENSSSITFTIDTTNPNITLISPPNNTYNTTASHNFTANLSDNLGIKNTTLYIYNETGLYNETSESFTSGVLEKTFGIIVTLVDGIYNWWYNIWDWAGNYFQSGNYTLTRDTTAPYISIVYPLNNSNVSGTGLNVNYTINDSNLDSCWYSNDTYTLNVTLANCINITTVIWSDGQHNVTIYANDSAGNENSSFVTFNVETGSSVTFCRELNTANTTYTLQNDMFTASDCFTVNAPNITIDFDGNRVSGDCGFWDDGIIVGYNNYTTIKNGRLDSFYHQIYITGAYNLNLTNMTFNGSCYSDTYNSFHNSSITNIVGLGGSGTIYTAGSGNIIDNINMSYYDGGYNSGVSIAGDYNIVKNSFFQYNTKNGIYISSRYNNFTNNTMHSNQECEINLGSNSDGNIFTNNTLQNCSTSGTYACIYVDNSDDCIFDENIINDSKGYGIWIDSDFTDSVGNMFRNTNITNTVLTTINLSDAGGLNNTFLNMSYSNESVETGSELVRKWYYRAFVNDTSGNNVSNANITAFNVTGDFEFNLTTDATGYTPIHSITEYTNNGGTVFYFSNHNIYAKNESYSSVNHSYNVSSNLNNFKDVFTLTSAQAPEIKIISPTAITYSISSIEFNVSSNKNISTCKFTIDNWATNYTMTEFNKTYFNYSKNLGDTIYTARFWCNDSSDNINNTETVIFIVDAVSPTGGGGGGSINYYCYEIIGNECIEKIISFPCSTEGYFNNLTDCMNFLYLDEEEEPTNLEELIEDIKETVFNLGEKISPKFPYIGLLIIVVIIIILYFILIRYKDYYKEKLKKTERKPIRRGIEL